MKFLEKLKAAIFDRPPVPSYFFNAILVLSCFYFALLFMYGMYSIENMEKKDAIIEHLQKDIKSCSEKLEDRINKQVLYPKY